MAQPVDPAVALKQALPALRSFSITGAGAICLFFIWRRSKKPVTKFWETFDSDKLSYDFDEL